MVKYYLYVLRSLKDKKFYVGMTSNLENRFKRHNAGLVASTKNRLPFELVYVEEANNSKEAREKEKYYKSGRGREKLKQFLVSLK